MTRDTNERMLELLFAEAGDGDFVPSLVAAAVFVYLDEHDTDFLIQWLYENGPTILTEKFSKALAQRRAMTLSRREGDRFAQWATAPTEERSVFEVRYRIDEDHTARKLGEMDATDHVFVASRYEVEGNRELMLAAFHRAVAKKLTKGRKTSQVLSEVQYETLYRSITGESPTAVAV